MDLDRFILCLFVCFVSTDRPSLSEVLDLVREQVERSGDGPLRNSWSSLPMNAIHTPPKQEDGAEVQDAVDDAQTNGPGIF
jgi:hypothetical protein